MGTVAGLLLLLFALWAWLHPPDRQTIVRTAEASAEVPLSAGVAPPAIPLPEAELEVEPSAEAEREAVLALAEAGGLTFVRCPASSRQRYSFHHPGRCVTGPAGEMDCAVDQSAGSIRIEAAGSLQEMLQLPGDAPPLSSLTWWTDPSGETHCTEEAPEPRTIRLRVFDGEGRPVPEAYVMTMPSMTGGPTDADGRATLTVYASTPVKALAIVGHSLSETILVAPGEAELSVRVDVDPDATEADIEERLSDARDAERAEQRASIAASLAVAGLSPEAAEVLAGWDAELAEDEAHRASEDDEAAPDAD